MYYLIALVAVIIDQLVKYFTVQNLSVGGVQPLIPGILSLTHIHNEGAAWSILEGQMGFFYVITLVVVVFIVYYMRQVRGQSLAQLSLAFILGGAIGNFIDRLLHQYVIDMFMLEFINFPIFNIADSFLTVGVILMIIHVIFFEEE